MNLEFLIVTIIVAKAIDWIFQTQEQAENKTKSIRHLVEHSFEYSTYTVGILILIGTITTGITAGIVWVALLLSHMIIDDRSIVKFIMYCKGLSWEQINSEKYGWLQIGIDQRLHELMILLLVLVI